MQSMLKSFEEAFRKMLLEKAVNRMKEDADKCLITESREKLKFYQQRENVKAFEFKGSVEEFDALFRRLSERLKAAENSMSEIMVLQGTKEGLNFRMIYIQRMTETVRRHRLIILGKDATSKGNGGIQPCLAD